jgi:cephalosporin hydroxylase
MIKKDLSNCSTLEEFYSSIIKLYDDAHTIDGVKYSIYYDAIAATAKECNSYRECGVQQGGSVAAAALSGVSYIQVIDVSLRLFKDIAHLFKKYNKDLKLEMHESSSVPGTTQWKNRTWPGASDDVMNLNRVDITFLDAIHTYEYVSRELSLHAPTTDKYIFIHDTYQQRANSKSPYKIDRQLHMAALDYIKDHPEWVVDEYCEASVGYTKLKRVSYD